MKIQIYHGSPGNIDDFKLLKESLIKKLPQTEFLGVNRFLQKNYGHVADIHLGFSFGCVQALIDALESKTVKKVILISPYLFPNKKIGPLMETLINQRFFRKYIIPILAKKKIEEMLFDGLTKEDLTIDLSSKVKKYIEPESLAYSLLEKNITHDTVMQLLKKLEDKKIPVIAIFGDQDKTSYLSGAKTFQHGPLVKFKNINIKLIKNAGHYQIWTHVDDISEHIKNFIDNTIEEKIKMNNNTKPFGYFVGTHEGNNVANFLKDHKEKYPTQNILTWIPQEELLNWNKDLNTPLKSQSVKVAELDHLVAILTTEFRRCGIQFGDRVILFLPMSLYMYAAMFALQKMGAVPTFLDSWARRDQMGVSAKVANPTAMISADRAFAYLNDIPEIADIKIKIVAGPIESKDSKINYTAHLEHLLQGSIPDGISPVEKEHTALITFTTGSSGTPKGADRSHRFLAAQHYALNRHLPYSKGDKDLPVFPIFSLNNLAAGVETIIPAIDVGSPAPTDALVLYAQMKSCGVTCTTLSPSLFNNLSQFCLDRNLNLNFLRRIVTGGAPISRDDIKRMKSVAKEAEILVLYGSTEVEPMAHIEAKEMLAQKEDNDSEIVEAGVNVGHLDSGLRFKFIKINKDAVFVNNEDEWKNLEVSKDDVGELIVAGEHVCEKYYNNEEAFFRAKIKDHENVIWHRTGDLGFLDSENNLWIVGRVHNAINRNGEYFFPVRAEIILKKFDFIDKAAFLGINDSPTSEKTYAVFSLKNKNIDLELAKTEIRRVLEKNKFKVDEILNVENIPMDPRHHSKVEYDILRKIISSSGQ